MEEIKLEFLIVLKLIAGLFLGALIGFDREKQGIDAGVRTYAGVCLSATLFTSVADHLQDMASSARIIANIVVGIGFLGSGIIFRSQTSNSAHGLTTAATLWGTAAVGVAVGLNMFVIAVVSSLLLYFLLAMDRFGWYNRWKRKVRHKE